jgi:hypothetical protein
MKPEMNNCNSADYQEQVTDRVNYTVRTCLLILES